MNRADKTAAIDRLNQDFSRHPHLVLATFQRLTVNQANDLRRKIRRVGGRYQVIKNRLARRAAAGTGAETLSPRFTGPCAVAMHENDPIALARVLAEFAKDNPQIELAGGVVDARETLDAEGVRQLATLPGLPELRAQLLSVIQSPATMLVRLLTTPGSQLARALDARREKLQD